jgi:hypothetical protein
MELVFYLLTRSVLKRDEVHATETFFGRIYVRSVGVFCNEVQL